MENRQNPNRQPNHAMTIIETSAPQIGQPLPPFSLPAVLSDGTQSVLSNADFVGKAFVLFVYPKDATSGCTIEAQGFRELYSEFRVLDIEVIGLSRDTVGAHRKFIAAQTLPFALLADKEQTLLRSWDLISNGTMYGKSVTKVKRTTFLVDESGVVRHIWNEVLPTGHAAEVLQCAREEMSKPLSRSSA